MDRTLRVTGTGSMTVKPDVVRLLLTQNRLHTEYFEAVKASAEDKERLTSVFERLGFRREELKTLSFSLNPRYESYQTADMCWKERLTGYEYIHCMKIEFPEDRERLGSVLYELAKDCGECRFSIEYTVSDPEKIKNELLAEAVRDGQKKARILAETADVRLGEIQTIDYSFETVTFSERPVSNMKMAVCCDTAEEDCIGMEIEADDLKLQDTVTILYSIL